MVPRLVLVGGFLGSGKTTLLLSAAATLRERGTRAAIILNDQAGELVDTRLARAAGLEAGEVSGGCFCCRFSEFVRSAGALLASEPAVIFAEPVGSCADLAATVLRPLERLHGDRFRIAPFTVLVDPERAGRLTAPDADPLLAYLFRQQVAEADLVVLSKSDLEPEGPPIAGIRGRRVSAVTGEGVEEWLDEVMRERAAAGGPVLDMDYQRYAAAEAALGWLNWRAMVGTRKALTPAAVAGPFLAGLDRLLTDAGAEIVHMKLFVQAETGHLKASVCRNGESPSVAGPLDAPPARSHELVLNLRAKADPECLVAAVETAAAALPGRVRVQHASCFRPAPPQPEHRFER